MRGPTVGGLEETPALRYAMRALTTTRPALTYFLHARPRFDTLQFRAMLGSLAVACDVEATSLPEANAEAAMIFAVQLFQRRRFEGHV